MEDYDLRSCFLPDLSGLHLRIFQFQGLLRQHMPKLAAHLDALGVESAYLSQWFLSFFAVTCPLPMLFRIYDVLFAEGASETIMRVALALMKRNEQKLLALTEFEDVMQLLLGRSLWDPYGRNAKSADELVNDFVSFTNDVTRESLQGLEAAFKEAQKTEAANKEVQKSASSFLGRLWPISVASTKSGALSPGLTAPRPMSFLRRTPSKQSLASTLNSELGSESSTATQSTALTDVSRGSSGESLWPKTGHDSVAASIRSGPSSKDRDLHYQIEQLLMSVSQLQRQNAELEAALQKQREDRREDHRIVRNVIDRMRSKPSSLSAPTSRASRRRTTITAAILTPPDTDSPPTLASSEEIQEAVELLDARFPTQQTHHRASSMFETKAVLKDSLARTKEQLSSETVRASSLARDLADAQAELHLSRDALKETRQRLQDSYNQTQRQEKTIQELRLNQQRKPSFPWTSAGSDGSDVSPTLSRSNTTDSVMTTSSTVTTTGGLRELRLGRSSSQKMREPHPQPSFSKRVSSLAAYSLPSSMSMSSSSPSPPRTAIQDSKEKEASTPPGVPESEALVLELVNAKTAEAVARQELDELRSRFEGLRRAMSAGGPGQGQNQTGSAAVGVSASSTTPVSIGVGTGVGGTPSPQANAGGGGGFWSGWKRNVSTTNASLN
jgi:hypothetical protein